MHSIHALSRRGTSPHLAQLVACWLCAVVLAGCSREPSSPPPAANSARSLAVAGAAAEGMRIALVVGNGHYESSPLTNPVNDAELIATTLRELGFEVQLKTDSNQSAMKRAIQDFGAALERGGPNAVGLFYYAGHGVQLNGRNYLIPVGASIARDADVDIEAVSADWVLEQMRYARNRLNFVILDACRNNPFARSFRSGDRGLAKMDAPAGVLIAYSTAPGDVAADGAGRNSPYSEALAQAMRGSTDPAELMFKQARDAVRGATQERQTPWESSSLTGRNFYFATRGQVAALPSPSPSPSPSASLPEAATAQPALPPAPDTAPVAAASRASVPGPAAAPAPQDDLQIPVDPFCARAVGDWKINSDKRSGILRLQANDVAIARLKGSAASVPVSWDCDGPGRKIHIRYEHSPEEEVIMDGEEKLLFGYDKSGAIAMYTR